jgi:hypothetical protein
MLSQKQTKIVIMSIKRFAAPVVDSAVLDGVVTYEVSSWGPEFGLLLVTCTVFSYSRPELLWASRVKLSSDHIGCLCTPLRAALHRNLRRGEHLSVFGGNCSPSEVSTGYPDSAFLVRLHSLQAND